jgi:hypothetical protein
MQWFGRVCTEQFGRLTVTLAEVLTTGFAWNFTRE